MSAPAQFDTLTLFDALREAGLEDSQARAIVTAKKTTLESCRNGKMPDTREMESGLRAAGFTDSKTSALVSGFRVLAERLLRERTQ